MCNRIDYKIIFFHRSAASSVHYTTSCNTQSSASEDGRNNCPKHVELIEIINKPLLLHLVGCLYYCISDARSYKRQIVMNIFINDLVLFKVVFEYSNVM